VLSQSRRPSSWFTEILAGATVFSGVGYLLAAYTVSRWLTRPSRGRPRPTPTELNFPFEEIHCRTADGFDLSGWLIAPPHPRGTVMLFHGLRHNRSQTMPRISMLVEAGYRCVAFDHRAHGLSVGRCSSFGYYERRDVEAVHEFVGQRWPNEFCAALGISMGAAALCFASQRVRNLDAIILESLYHDVASAFDNRIGTKFPGWFRRFARGAIWVTERRLGLKLAQITPADHVGNLAPAPLLLMTGSADAHAPPADIVRLHTRCPGPCEMAEIEGADHSNLCTKDAAAYRGLVLGFLEPYWQSHRAAHPISIGAINKAS
jgi:uncharacterized protein